MPQVPGPTVPRVVPTSSASDGGDTITVRQSRFTIPFVSDPARDPHLKAINLFVSANRGRDWSLSAVAAPDDKLFDVSVPGDGEYWFAVQSIDQNGSRLPADMTTSVPQIKMRVKAGQTHQPASTAPADRATEIGVLGDEIERLGQRLRELEDKKRVP